MIDGDYDVFGDGSVRILKTPGHTPGHGLGSKPDEMSAFSF